MEFLFFAPVVWLICGIFTGIVASNKGKNGGVWLLVGLFLGVIGLIIALCISETDEKKAEKAEAKQKASIEQGEMKKCAFCAELIKAEAVVCRYCGKALDAS